MQYTMPKRNPKAVLSENKVVLERMKQPLPVVQQLHELLGFVDQDDRDAFFVSTSLPRVPHSLTPTCHLYLTTMCTSVPHSHMSHALQRVSHAL